MDSDESVHSESEFYYPEEETPNEMTALKYEEVEQERQLSKIQGFIHSLRPDNTKKKTTYDLNIWRRYCSSVGEIRTLENIPPNELNILLCRLFMDVRKKDGGVCEPGTLTSLQRSIQRCLKDNNFNTNILKKSRVCKVKGGPDSSQARLSSQQREGKSSTDCPRAN